jgi:hypothetical protein
VQKPAHSHSVSQNLAAPDSELLNSRLLNSEVLTSEDQKPKLPQSVSQSPKQPTATPKILAPRYSLLAPAPQTITQKSANKPTMTIYHKAGA